MGFDSMSQDGRKLIRKVESKGVGGREVARRVEKMRIEEIGHDMS
jgi:hypothetical protein